MAFPRGLAAGLLTANALGLLVSDIQALADQLDTEAEKNYLARETFANPAKALALRVADRIPLLWGLDPVAVAVGEHAAHAFAAHAGVVCDVEDYRQALARPALRRAALAGNSERDIFADPDDQHSGPRPKVLLLAVRTGPAAEAARYQAQDILPGVDWIAPAEEIDADEPIRAGVLALRFELAAVYLGLAGGTIGDAGRYTSVTA
jgi:hypothetical protein